MRVRDYLFALFAGLGLALVVWAFILAIFAYFGSIAALVFIVAVVLVLLSLVLRAFVK